MGWVGWQVQLFRVCRGLGRMDVPQHKVQDSGFGFGV